MGGQANVVSWLSCTCCWCSVQSCVCILFLLLTDASGKLDTSCTVYGVSPCWSYYLVRLPLTAPRKVRGTLQLSVQPY